MGKSAMSKMKQYLDKLEALSPDQTMLKSSKVLLFLSGSSHLESACLTAGQLKFLEQICQWWLVIFPLIRDLSMSDKPKFPC